MGRATWAAVALAVLVAMETPLLDMLCVRPFRSPPKGVAAVLVTGCSSGLGRTAAVHLAGKGFTVFATVRRQRDVDDLVSLGLPLITPVLMDVTSSESVTAAAHRVAENLAASGKELVAVVNNAGVLHAGKMADMGVDEYRKTFDVNVFGVVRVSQAFRPMLVGGTGRVIIVGSVVGVISTSRTAPYSSSKHALEGVADAWRQEFDAPDTPAAERLSVSLIEPGAIATEMCKGHHKTCDAGALPAFAAAVEHAVTATYPRTRYQVAWSAGFPVWIAVKLHCLLPDRLMDLSSRTMIWLTGVPANMETLKH